MKVKVKNVLYDVSWERFLNRRKNKSKTVRQNVNGINRINTLCHVSIVNKDKVKSERYTRVHTGEAIQSSKDIFNKAIGRKVSLTKAIENFTKADRTVIWGIYKQRCKLR